MRPEIHSKPAPPPPSKCVMFRVEEVATTLRMSRQAVKELCRSGFIPGIPVNQHTGRTGRSESFLISSIVIRRLLGLSPADTLPEPLAALEQMILSGEGGSISVRSVKPKKKRTKA
jgi:hypothetical protein